MITGDHQKNLIDAISEFFFNSLNFGQIRDPYSENSDSTDIWFCFEPNFPNPLTPSLPGNSINIRISSNFDKHFIFSSVDGTGTSAGSILTRDLENYILKLERTIEEHIHVSHSIVEIRDSLRSWILASIIKPIFDITRTTEGKKLIKHDNLPLSKGNIETMKKMNFFTFITTWIPVTHFSDAFLEDLSRLWSWFKYVGDLGIKPWPFAWKDVNSLIIIMMTKRDELIQRKYGSVLANVFHNQIKKNYPFFQGCSPDSIIDILNRFRETDPMPLCYAFTRRSSGNEYEQKSIKQLIRIAKL